MTLAVFIDANIPIYTVGRPHPLKNACIDVLGLAAMKPEAFFTDAEVLQELLHRYLSLRAWAQGHQALADFTNLMRGRTAPMQLDDVEHAAGLVELYPSLSARDLIHVAVMARLGSTQIVTADKGFDQIVGIERLDPADVSLWQDQVTS